MVKAKKVELEQVQMDLYLGLEEVWCNFTAYSNLLEVVVVHCFWHICIYTIRKWIHWSIPSLFQNSFSYTPTYPLAFLMDKTTHAPNLSPSLAILCKLSPPPPPLTRFCSLPDCCQADLRVFLVSSLVCIIVHAWLSYGIRLLFKILFFFFGRQEQGKTVNCIGH